MPFVSELEASTTEESSHSRSPTPSLAIDSKSDTVSEEQQSNMQSDQSNNSGQLTAGSLAAVVISTLLSAIASSCLTAVVLSAVSYYRRSRRRLSQKRSSDGTEGARNGYKANPTVAVSANEAYELNRLEGNPGMLPETNHQSSTTYNTVYQTPYTFHHDKSPVYTYIDECSL